GAVARLTVPESADRVLLDAPMTPGNLYWVEESDDLSLWFLKSGTLLTPDSFLEIPSGWELPVSFDAKHFWRVAGGWPDTSGDDPLTSGLAGLTFVGGDSSGWTYDADGGVLRQEVADANPAEWLHFGPVYSDFL